MQPIAQASAGRGPEVISKKITSGRSFGWRFRAIVGNLIFTSNKEEAGAPTFVPCWGRGIERGMAAAAKTALGWITA